MTEPLSDLELRIAACRQRCTEAPASRAFIPLADLLRQAGRTDEALSILEAGLARHPRAVGALVTLARCLAGVGRTTQAAEVGGRILELDPDNLVALEILGEEEQRRGDLMAAIGHYERLAQLEPADRHWTTELGRLREQRLASAAAAAGDAEGGFATLTLVNLYLAQGYRQKAETLLRRLADERPGDAVVRGRLAELVGADDDHGASVERMAPPALPRLGPGAGDKREQSREQFAMWIERLKAERGATP